MAENFLATVHGHNYQEYPDVPELVEAPGSPGAPNPPDPPNPSESAKRKKRRWPLILVGILAAIVFLAASVVGAIIIVAKSNDAPTRPPSTGQATSVPSATEEAVPAPLDEPTPSNTPSSASPAQSPSNAAKSSSAATASTVPFTLEAACKRLWDTTRVVYPENHADGALCRSTNAVYEDLRIADYCDDERHSLPAAPAPPELRDWLCGNIRLKDKDMDHICEVRYPGRSEGAIPPPDDPTPDPSNPPAYHWGCRLTTDHELTSKALNGYCASRDRVLIYAVPANEHDPHSWTCSNQPRRK